MSKSLKQYFNEIEKCKDLPMVGDLYIFVINEEISIVSSVIQNLDKNGYILSLDKKSLSLLETIGYTLGENKKFKEIYRINSLGKLNSPEGEITVVPGDMIYIYMDPKYDTWNNIVLVKDEDKKVVHDIDIESDGFKHVFSDAVCVNENKLYENVNKKLGHVFANEPNTKEIKMINLPGYPEISSGIKLKNIRPIYSCNESKNYKRIWVHNLLCSIPISKLIK